jgi:hypothetical protein
MDTIGYQRLRLDEMAKHIKFRVNLRRIGMTTVDCRTYLKWRKSANNFSRTSYWVCFIEMKRTGEKNDPYVQISVPLPITS